MASLTPLQLATMVFRKKQESDRIPKYPVSAAASVTILSMNSASQVSFAINYANRFIRVEFNLASRQVVFVEVLLLNATCDEVRRMPL